MSHICNFNFSRSYLKKQKQVKLILIIYFIKHNISKMSFQHAINIPKFLKRWIFFHAFFKIKCVFDIRGQFCFELATFQVLPWASLSFLSCPLTDLLSVPPNHCALSYRILLVHKLFDFHPSPPLAQWSLIYLSGTRCFLLNKALPVSLSLCGSFMRLAESTHFTASL